MHTILKGKAKEVTIGIDRPFVMIGEKINPPAARSWLPRWPKATWSTSASWPKTRLPGGRKFWMSTSACLVWTRWPSSRRSSNWSPRSRMFRCASTRAIRQVLAAGLTAAPGKPLVNSVSGEEKRLEGVLPLVKEHAAAVIGLTMDDRGIPGHGRGTPGGGREDPGTRSPAGHPGGGCDHRPAGPDGRLGFAALP